MLWRRRLACSFCGRDETEVAKLVAGPKVYICDRCVALATEIMSGRSGQVPAPAPRRPALARLLGWLGFRLPHRHQRMASAAAE